MHIELQVPFIDVNAVLNWMSLKGGHGAWVRDGSVVIRNMFEWVFQDDDLEPGQQPLSQLLTDEFNMYKHRLRERGNMDNYGWLRNQLYGVFQQEIRQSPAYCACYVALREDHCHRLISYPYCFFSTVMVGGPFGMYIGS